MLNQKKETLTSVDVFFTFQIFDKFVYITFHSHSNLSRFGKLAQPRSVWMSKKDMQKTHDLLHLLCTCGAFHHGSQPRGAFCYSCPSTFTCPGSGVCHDSALEFHSFPL